MPNGTKWVWSRKNIGGSVMNNHMTLEFTSLIENVVFARTAAISFLINLDLKMGVINEIKTIISEAVTNCIVHGYEGREDEIVYLDMQYDANTLTLQIIDKGIGIEDIEKAKEPLFTTKASEERAGLGFTIIEVFSDDLIIESTINEGTKLTIKKNLVNETE